MANNTKKEENLGDTSAKVTVGEGGRNNGPRRLQILSKNRKKLLIGLAAVIILVVSWLAVGNKLHVGQKVYAQAAGHKIYYQDIQNLIGTNKGISYHDAATVLANMYLMQAMAKEDSITVSSQDIESQYGASINYQKIHYKYAYQDNVNNVYLDKLVAYNAGLYTGKLLVTNFSRNIAFQSPFLAEQEAEDPTIGNSAAIAQDKQYAYNLITKLYNQIKAHKITFDQAIQIEHNDPTVGLSTYPTTPHSGPFDTSNVYLTADALIAPMSVQPIIENMKAGQLSKPFVVSVGDVSVGNKSTTETYYLVVRMDSTSGGHSGLNFNQVLAQAKKRLGYKVYV